MPAVFVKGMHPWLQRLGMLRNVVRQELVTRQLREHLPAAGSAVLDVGAGQGTQAIQLAREGYRVTAVEPDPRMRAASEAVLVNEPESVRRRMDVRAGGLGELTKSTHGATYDVVLCHGVLMYLPDSAPAIAELARAVAPDGILSLLARNGAAMAWRPALRRQWTSAAAMLDEVERATLEGRDAIYDNEIGVRARADRLDRLVELLTANGLGLRAWYGVRVATDGVPVDEQVPDDPAELAALLDIEERLGRTDPYRALGTLLHIVAGR